MRDRERDMQIIEVLSPRDPYFPPGTHGTTDASSPPRPRRPGSRGLTTLMAGLGAAVFAAAIGLAIAGDDPAATAPTTTVAATSRLSPTEPGDTALSGRFVIDHPDLRPYSADIVTPLGEKATFQLWTSGDPTKPWLSVHAVHSVGDSYMFTNSSRRVVDGLELVSPRDRPDTTDVVISEGGWTVTIHGSGVNDGDLTSFANGLAVNGGGTVDTSRALEALGLTPAGGHLGADQQIYGAVTSEMRSLTADGGLITLRVADGSIQDLKSLPYFATGLLSGTDGRISGTLVATGEAVVIWSAGGHVLSLTGAVAADQLLQFSRAVRGATESEWKGMLYGLRPDYRIGEFATVANGLAGDGSAWLAGMQLAERDDRTQYLWWWTSPDRPETSASVMASGDLALAPTIDTIVVRGATYVFVSVPTSSAVMNATITAADGTITEVALVQPFPHVPVRSGGTRVDTPGAIGVAIDSSATP